MEFTIFTLFVSIFWVSIFVIIISILRKQMLFLNFFSIYPLLLLLTFCILRLFFPIELPFTKVINSHRVLPFIQSVFSFTLIQIGFIKVNLELILLLVWGLGIIFIIFKYLRRYYRFRQLLDFLPGTENNHLYEVFLRTNPQGLLAKAKIIVHDSVESPAIFGFIRPVLLLPPINFDDDELLALFIHENAHYKYKHGIIKCITQIVRACFWWNPFFKELPLEMSHALEMHSDKTVYQNCNVNQQKKYLICIANIASNMHTAPPNLTCNLIEEKSEDKLKQRFKMILDGVYQSKKPYNFLIIPVLLAMFFFSYSVVLQPYSLPNSVDIGSETEITVDNYLVKTDDGYELYDSNHVFIAYITHLDDSLNGLKIYKNREDAK